MSSANSFLSSTTYHTTNSRFSNTQSPTYSVQQQLNDLNSTRSSASSCSTSHCFSHQCIECTTILSTRNLHSYIDQTSNTSHFVQNCSYVSNSTVDNATVDEQPNTRIFSMNIPVENSNSSTLNIEGNDADEDEAEVHSFNEQNEQLEVFVGFYRPGEYQRETMEEDDDASETSLKSDTQKKEEQSTRELISDEDEGNEDQDFIDEDFGPNQDEETDQLQQDIEEPLNPNILNNNPPMMDVNEQILFVHIDEDEDQGFGAQFNDDCQSSDDENNHLSTLSLNHHQENDLTYSDKKPLQRSQSDSDLCPMKSYRFLSLPNFSRDTRGQYEKTEHFIIDDQQPTTTISNLIIKKKQNDENDYLFLRKKKILRKSSEEILEISKQASPPQMIVDEAVRDVERRVMLWDDDLARWMDNQSSLQQIVQYFQLNIVINEEEQSRPSSIRKELLLDYLQYRSEVGKEDFHPRILSVGFFKCFTTTDREECHWLNSNKQSSWSFLLDISANDLHENLLQYPEFSSRIHCRFFPFWPPRDVDLLQWLSYWIKQGALPVAIMNMGHSYSQKSHLPNNTSFWQHRLIYGVEPRGIYLMNPIQIQSPQQVYEQLTVDAVTYITRQEIVQRYNQSPMSLTPLAIRNNQSKLFSDTRWRTMNVLGQVVNVLREDRQSSENETRNIPFRPTVTHVRIPSTCSSGILLLSKDSNQLLNAIDLPLRQ